MREPNMVGSQGAEAQGVAFAKALGVTSDDPAALRALSAEQIMRPAGLLPASTAG